MVSVTRRPWRWAAALARRAGIDANPLRRRCDRVEAWARLSLVLVFLVLGPLSVMGMGHWASVTATRTAHAQAAGERLVTAVLPTGAHHTAGYPSFDSPELVWAPARWTAPDGAKRSGEVPAQAGTGPAPGCPSGWVARAS